MADIVEKFGNESHNPSMSARSAAVDLMKKSKKKAGLRRD